MFGTRSNGVCYFTRRCCRKAPHSNQNPYKNPHKNGNAHQNCHTNAAYSNSGGTHSNTHSALTYPQPCQPSLQYHFL